MGELYAIYLVEESKGAGIGKSLWEKSLKDLHALGYTEVTLWVLDTNERARRFYERVGFVPEDIFKQVNIGGQEVREIRYRYNVSAE